jgi:hypothetical protein
MVMRLAEVVVLKGAETGAIHQPCGLSLSNLPAAFTK